MLKSTFNMVMENPTKFVLSFLLLFLTLEEVFIGCDGTIDIENAYFSSHLTHRFHDKGKLVLVFDEIFDSEAVGAFLSLSSSGYHKFPWNFNYVDKYEKNHGTRRADNIQWTSKFDSKDLFTKTSIWRKIKLLTTLLSGGKTYIPYDVEYTMTRRFDHNIMCSDSEETSDDLVAQIFLNNDSSRNDYAETVFYKDDGEILASIYPRQGRLIIWNASVPVVYKPPAMSYIQAKYRLHMKLTTLLEKASEGFEAFDKLDNFHQQQALVEFALNDSLPLPSINLDLHQTRKFFDSQGRVIAVYDNVLDKKDLDTLRTWFLNYNTQFMNQPYDPDPREDHDNVSWIAVVKVALFVKSRLWRIVQMIAEHLSGSKDWYPYDVSMNIIRTAHSTRIHADCEEHEFEYTFLMYLTPDWDAHNYGETTFFEEVRSSNGEEVPKGSEQYELIGAVRPRYGRIVIFRGIIPHSARPPSPAVDGARLTFACKVSKNERVAFAKMLQETMEYIDENHEEQELAEELVSGLHENPHTSPLTDQNIKEKLKYHRKERERLISENLKKMVDVMMK